MVFRNGLENVKQIIQHHATQMTQNDTKNGEILSIEVLLMSRASSPSPETVHLPQSSCYLRSNLHRGWMPRLERK